MIPEWKTIESKSPPASNSVPNHSRKGNEGLNSSKYSCSYDISSIDLVHSDPMLNKQSMRCAEYVMPKEVSYLNEY